MIDAIHWRWPGAHVVVRGGVLARWDGPMSRPTDAEIAQAVADYEAQNVKAAVQRDQAIDSAPLAALATALNKRFKDGTTDAQWKAAIKAEYDALASGGAAVPVTRAKKARKKR